MPKVSIITASYNYAQYIRDAIESVIGQTFQDWEMLIIDDGSTDNSAEIIDEYIKKDNRIRLYSHLNNKNKGLIETLKLGISQAKGEYIVFLESDDYIEKDYLQKKLETFEKYSDAGFVYNDVEILGSKLTLPKKIYFWTIRHYWKNHNYPHHIYEWMYLKNFVPTFSCVMLKKELLEDINWNTPVESCIDWWLWTQISQKTKFCYLPDKLTYWRLHLDSYIKQSKKEDRKKMPTYHTLLYSMLPPMKQWNNKLIFIPKQILLSLEYRKNTLSNLKHIFKK